MLYENKKSSSARDCSLPAGETVLLMVLLVRWERSGCENHNATAPFRACSTVTLPAELTPKLSSAERNIYKARLIWALSDFT